MNARKYTKDNRARLASMLDDELLAYAAGASRRPLHVPRNGQGVVEDEP